MSESGGFSWLSEKISRAVARLRTSEKNARDTKSQTLANAKPKLSKADNRLRPSNAASSSVPQPHNADWAWRPDTWSIEASKSSSDSVANASELCPSVKIFHDSSVSDMVLRQVCNTLATTNAAFGLQLDVPHFTGSFLSLAFDFPDAAVNDLKRSHILQISTSFELKKPLEVFARLNIRHGPNTEQIVRELPNGELKGSAEFDLAYVNLNEKRIEAAWVDLIFDNPDGNQIYIHDVTFTRRPRAQL